MMTISKPVTLKRFSLAATILAAPLIAAAPTKVSAQVVLGVSIQIAPPVLPVYVQPAMPEAGYMWTPGYWAYGQVGYYWVPGTWVEPPIVGVLWTPPYWGWSNGAYVFYNGYWGPHVGFYGGVNYGYGYGGSGYDGGRWDGGHFAYNRSANDFGSVKVQNTYEENLTVNNRTNVSYVGGADGLKAAPTAAERSAENDRHTPATAEQARHLTAAAGNPAFAASHNNGHPAIAATSRPAQFEGAGAAHPVPASAAARPTEPATVAHPAEHAAQPGAVVHPGEHAAGPAAVAPAVGPAAAHPVVAHPAEQAPAAPHPAVAHPAAQAPAAARPAVVHPAEQVPAAPHPVVAHTNAPPVEHAAVHPAVAHEAAPHPAPAPAHEVKSEEKK
jgi:hypothetical protein